MSILGSLLKIIEWLHHIDAQIECQRDETAQLRRENHELTNLSKQNLALAKQLQDEFKGLAQLAGDLRVAMPLITEIRDAVVGEPVVKVVLSVHPSGGNTMDMQVGQKSTLTFKALGASGNPTTPISAPQFQSSDTTNFTLDVASDGQSAVVTATGPVGSANQVDVVVDGIESNVLEFDIVSAPPPPPEPVAAVVLSATDPA